MRRHLVVTATLLALAACKGPAGADGSNGAVGPPGADAQPCSAVDNGDGTKTVSCPGSLPVTISTSCSVASNGDGTAIVSCTDGSHAFLAPPLATALAAGQPLPGVVVTILSLTGDANGDGSFAPGDRLGVTFTLKTGAGRFIPIEEVDVAGAWIAGPVTGYQRLLPAARDAEMITDVAARATLNADGSYTYVFADPIPATFGVPLHDTTKFTDGELTGALPAGTYTVALLASKDYTVGGALAPDAGSAARDFGLGTTTLASRAVVADANCNRCHASLRMHAGRYRALSLCVTCHTAGAEDVGSTDAGDPTPVTIDFAVLIHKLHDGAHLPSVNGITTDATGARVYGLGTPYRVGSSDYSAVNFPAFPNPLIPMPKDAGYSALASGDRLKEDGVRTGVTACAVCHGDPDGAGPLGAPAGGAAALSSPSRRACGSCHDDLDYARPYSANGQTMPADMADGACGLCHTAGALAASHLHPMQDPIVAPEATVEITALTGATGAGGQFLAGDPLGLTLTLEDAAGVPLPITAMDSFSLALTGPTQNRQVVIPGALAASPFDLSGRLASSSTALKGSMSKVVPAGVTTSETLTVQFTTPTTFTLTGSTSGLLASGTLPFSPGAVPLSAFLSNVVLAPSAVAQEITVSFSGATTYSVAGSVSGPMGTGTLPASTRNTQRFTSVDGSVSFNLVLISSAPAAGSTFYLSVVRGGTANPVLFALVGGRNAFGAGDRFYYDYVAPAPSYSLPFPMELPLERLGVATGSAGDVFSAANLPVRYGRQTLLERTATPGGGTVTTAGAPMMGRYLEVASVPVGLAVNDYVVIDDGTANEEYARVGELQGAGLIGLSSATPLRFSHAPGALVQEVTLTFRQEGSDYTLDPAAGTITLAAPATPGNTFLLSYRTDARFGWKRRPGDAVEPFYFANLLDSPSLDERSGDWRGKPLVDGTYTVGAWGYRTLEHRSGATGAWEWQTYRGATRAAQLDLLYGSSATTVAPYAKIGDGARCDACHVQLTFHGATRRGADGCLLCHATPGLLAGRTLLHRAHGATFPAMPNGVGNCAACHGESAPLQPSSRSHPTAQGRPALDWTTACTSCHTTPAAAVHAETHTGATSGLEGCATCHGPGRTEAVEEVHRAR